VLILLSIRGSISLVIWRFKHHERRDRVALAHGGEPHELAQIGLGLAPNVSHTIGLEDVAVALEFHRSCPQTLSAALWRDRHKH